MINDDTRHILGLLYCVAVLLTALKYPPMTTSKRNKNLKINLKYYFVHLVGIRDFGFVEAFIVRDWLKPILKRYTKFIDIMSFIFPDLNVMTPFFACCGRFSLIDFTITLRYLDKCQATYQAIWLVVCCYFRGDFHLIGLWYNNLHHYFISVHRFYFFE